MTLPAHRHVLERVASIALVEAASDLPERFRGLLIPGRIALKALKNLFGIVALIGQMVLDLRYLFSIRAIFRGVNFPPTFTRAGRRHCRSRRWSVF